MPMMTMPDSFVNERLKVARDSPAVRSCHAAIRSRGHRKEPRGLALTRSEPESSTERFRVTLGPSGALHHPPPKQRMLPQWNTQEDPDDVGAPTELFVAPFLGGVRPDLAPVFDRDGGEGRPRPTARAPMRGSCLDRSSRRRRASSC